MTLHIIHSNKVENLHDELCHLLKNNPLENPFQLETIVCPSQAMARWLNIRFATQLGIAAHFDYPMPASWIWNFAAEILPNVPMQDPLQKDVMSWKIFFLLELNKNKASFEAITFEPIKRYLNNDTDSTKQWSLAKKIAFVFERYQHFRPTMIMEWDEGAGDDWQSELWRQLTQNIDSHRVQLLHQLGSFLASKKQQNLPQRVTFFSLSSLPPLLLNCVQVLAQHIEVYFFVLSPSAHYWSDFLSLKQQAKKRLNEPDLTAYFDTGHELLASWGRQGQVFQDMLLHELDDEHTEHFDVYDEAFNNTLLQQLQKTLFDLDDSELSIQADESIRINGCHSPLRECEILHDQCLTLLEETDISPEDILVIVPSIDDYAAAIEAIFKKSQDQDQVKPFIPWNLSDTSLRSESPLIRAFLDVLNLSNSRFTVSDILSFLDVPTILKRFNLETGDKAIIREYIEQGRINWGLDSEHKDDFNVPKTTENTWQNADHRFFTAYAIDAEPFASDTQPLAGFSSSRSLVIGQFLLLLDSLNEWRNKLSYQRPFGQWQIDLNECIDAIFSDHENLQIIRDAIDELVQNSLNSSDQEIKRELVHQCLSDQFEGSNNSQYFFSGGITFCGMRPMRSLPFKVIAMLGMNEHAFPRQNTPVEFDLMALQWKPGDLLISDEDRYLFLEALLCARHTLIISYCSKSIKDNADKEPSNLVSELCDYLDAHFKTNDKEAMSAQLMTQYAMHSYSESNYNEHYQSYNHFWCDVAQQLRQQPTQVILKNDEVIINEDSNVIELSRLIRCLKDPVKSYFNTQLKVYLLDENDTNDDENFDLDALQAWQLKDELLKNAVQSDSPNFNGLSTAVSLPHGSHAVHSYNKTKDDVEAQLETIDHYLNLPPENRSIDLKLIDEINLTGQVSGYFEGLGILHLSASSFGAKNLIEIWIAHCAMCAANEMSDNEKSVLNCKDGFISFDIIEIQQAHEYLLRAIDVMQQSKLKPINLFTKCSFTYQFELMKSDEQKALFEATKKWHGSNFDDATTGEKDSPYVHLAFNEFHSNPNPLLDTIEFKTLAAQLFKDALNHAQITGMV